MVIKLWKKFIQKPKYNPVHDNILIRNITSYPTPSFLLFVYLKTICTGSHTNSPIITSSYINIIINNLLLNIFFQGFWDKYIPTNNLSIITQGIARATLFYTNNDPINTCFYGITRALARRKYSLALLSAESFFVTTISFFIAKYWLF